MRTLSTFSEGFTPCRRRRSGESYEDRDGGTVLTELVLFACGCRVVRHEYHEGSVSRTVIRHDGTVLLHELLAAQ